MEMTYRYPYQLPREERVVILVIMEMTYRNIEPLFEKPML